MKTLRNIFRVIGSVIPHLEIVACLMFTTFFIVDCFNNAMMFVTHPMSKALTAVIGIFALILMITLFPARTYAMRRGIGDSEMSFERCILVLLFLAASVTIAFYVYDLKVPDRLLYTQRLTKNILLAAAIISFVSSIVTIRLQRLIFAYRHHLHRHEDPKE